MLPAPSQLHYLIREIMNANSAFWLMSHEHHKKAANDLFLLISASLPVISIINILVEFVYQICTGAKSVLESCFLPALVLLQAMLYCYRSLDSHSSVPWFKLHTAIYPYLDHLIRLGQGLQWKKIILRNEVQKYWGKKIIKLRNQNPKGI